MLPSCTPSQSVSHHAFPQCHTDCQHSPSFQANSHSGFKVPCYSCRAKAGSILGQGQVTPKTITCFSFLQTCPRHCCDNSITHPILEVVILHSYIPHYMRCCYNPWMCRQSLKGQPGLLVSTTLSPAPLPPFPLLAEGFAARGDALQQWLRARPETSIAVVCHYGICKHLTGKEFLNCEVQSYSQSGKTGGLKRVNWLSGLMSSMSL